MKKKKRLRKVNTSISFFKIISFFVCIEEKSLINNQQSEKAAPQQQLKPSRSQTSSSSASSSLMKGLNRSTTSNRVNLSSDVLKVKSILFLLK
jgi:hypothetical protein